MTEKERASCINTIELLRRLAFNVHGVMDVIDAENCEKIIAMLKQPDQKWIPVTWHYATESEFEERPDIASWFDCDMPNDGDEILVTTGHGNVEKDICYIDDSFYLDRYDWAEVKAWMPLPEPWRGESDG